jgi:hypothetical protein
MSYYCFLCNATHDDQPTNEHFIPRSLKAPEKQHLPVCNEKNERSHYVFDNDARDILYWPRFQETGELKRSGEALLAGGSLRCFRFSYREDPVTSKEGTEFRYIVDKDTGTHIPPETVYAIGFPVGLPPDEKQTTCRGLAKISLGTLVYRLRENEVAEKSIALLLSQEPFDALRHFSLDLPWSGRRMDLKFSLGSSERLQRLQNRCESKQTRNHAVAIQVNHNEIHLEGMLYSQLGWAIRIPSKSSIGVHQLWLENPILEMDCPDVVRDLSLSNDFICILNPGFEGPTPELPEHWKND